jgi:Xaa-Pro dipeptidase
MTILNSKIDRHIEAARLLNIITLRIFEFISNNPEIDEIKIKQKILDEFAKNNLKTNTKKQIIAFNEHASFPHYSPIKKTNKKLKENTIIKLDIWARLDIPFSPFADITWMAYYGKKVPDRIQNVFEVVIAARDKVIQELRSNLKMGKIPTGLYLDKIACDVIKEMGYGESILHRTGHSMGYDNPHGKLPHLNNKNDNPLKINQIYTIEPGIYIKDEFGVRSEIDFYISNNFELIITTDLQKTLIKL